MKNNSWFVILVLVVLVGGAYMYRSQIKSMLMGEGSYAPAPVAQTDTAVVPSTSVPPVTAPSDNVFMTKTDAVKGPYLTDFLGMTLYTYDKDTAGVSNCSGGCATAWPPYASGETAEGIIPDNITVITRTDGSQQFAWKGMPLYYYTTDTKTGDITGDGVGGVWHLVKP